MLNYNLNKAVAVISSKYSNYKLETMEPSWSPEPLNFIGSNNRSSEVGLVKGQVQSVVYSDLTMQEEDNTKPVKHFISLSLGGRGEEDREGSCP